ncbi:hypothetical protein D0466_03885 [Peribacillus glennii]|uniref:Uncharacterized protein n=1 Tax=Peribacillus glennii TaxID=2303991 RepID=A0A372LGF2_9BACI|nr:hypothetical protein D0466_03885 [Peribacillus glennii]
MYSYNDIKVYIEEVVRFIQDGILAGDYVILIEIDRVFPNYTNRTAQGLTKEQMSFVHRVNYFNFYYSSGSYHHPSITDSFNKTVQPYVETFVPITSPYLNNKKAFTSILIDVPNLLILFK